MNFIDRLKIAKNCKKNNEWIVPTDIIDGVVIYNPDSRTYRTYNRLEEVIFLLQKDDEIDIQSVDRQPHPIQLSLF